MSKSDVLENSFLQLFFNNVAASNIGDASGLQPSGSAGNLYVALHTADPTESGTQASSEATFTGYLRVAVVRSAGGWTVSGNSVSNTAAVTFPLCTGGSNTITHFSVGFASSGATAMDYSGTLASPLNVSNGITPSFAIGVLAITED